MNDTTKTVMTPVMNKHSDIDVKLEELLTNYVPREKLRAVVFDVIRHILILHTGASQRADTDAPLRMASENVVWLHDSAVVALPPALCTLMARLGFDKSLFTYGHADGRAVGFAEGYWLLKFVGLADTMSMARQRMTSAA